MACLMKNLGLIIEPFSKIQLKKQIGLLPFYLSIGFSCFGNFQKNFVLKSFLFYYFFKASQNSSIRAGNLLKFLPQFPSPQFIQNPRMK